MIDIFADPVWLLIAVLNVSLVFLIMLNGYLRGAYRQHIDAVLSVLIIAVFVVIAFLYGWLLILLHIVGSFIVGAILQQVAARTAAKLLKGNSM